MNKSNQYRVQWSQPYSHWTPTKTKQKRKPVVDTDTGPDPLLEQKEFPEARALLDRIRKQR